MIIVLYVQESSISLYTLPTAVGHFHVFFYHQIKKLIDFLPRRNSNLNILLNDEEIYQSN